MELEYKFKERYNPKSNRLQNYDYSSNGGYFITICTKNRENYFGEIIDGTMILNQIGEIVKNEILNIGIFRENVILDEFVIMPNHIHFVLILDTDENILEQETINRVSDTSIFAWQSNYYDRIIRDEDELDRIRKYIRENPEKWELDKDNSENLYM